MDVNNIRIGRKIGFKFWNYIYELSRNKVQSKQEVELRLVNLVFSTANSCVIKYERVDTRQKYEFFMQGRFGEHYRRYIEDNSYRPEDIHIEKEIKRSYLNEDYYEVNRS